MPSVPDPRLNTAECVISGQEKASHFSGLKYLLPGVCWSSLVISLVMGVFVSQQVLVHLKNWDEGKIAGVMLLCLFIFVAEIPLSVYALIESTAQQDLYVRVFVGFVALVLCRRLFYCISIHCRNRTPRRELQWGFTSGHGENTSKNILSWVFIYPAAFIACHHVLWILLGVITEPLWGSTVLVGVTSFFSVFYFLVCDLYNEYFSDQNSRVLFFMALILISGGFFAFVLLLLVLLVVAQGFFGESLISTVVQNGLVAIGTVGYSYLKTETGFGGGEGGGGGGGGGEGEGGGGGRGGGRGGRGRGRRRAGARRESRYLEERVELRTVNGNNSR